MNHLANRTIGTLSLLAAAALLPAQSTLIVGAGGSYAEIVDAIAAAAPGDRIHVEPGNYLPFQTSKALTIRGVGNQRPNIVGSSPALLVPAPGESTILCDLHFTVPVNVTGGRVVFTDCLLQHSQQPLAATNATVHLIDCEIRTLIAGPHSGPAFTADSSDVTATGSEFVGPVAIRANASRLHLAHIEATGAMQNHAIVAVDTTIWLSDSTVSSHLCPLSFSNTNHSLARVTQYVPPVLGSCTNPLPDNASLISVEQRTALKLGQTFSLDFMTAPQSFVIVFASTGLDTVNWAPFLLQPSWGNEAQSVSVGLLVSDATGAAPVSWPIPNSSSLIDATLWFQGVGGTTFPLQTSPVAGGVAR